MLGIDFPQFISAYTFENYLISIFQKLILFVEYILIKKYLQKDFYISNQTWISSIILVICSIITPQILISQYISKEYDNTIVVLISLVTFIITNMMTYSILVSSNKEHKRILEQEILLEEKKHQEKIIYQIEKKIDEMNRLNHDINNHKLTIKHMIENQSFDEIDNYVNQLFTSPSYIKTNNTIINYILNEKMEYAKNKGIDIKCLIQGDLSETISTIDLSIVLGNLLDNAIEACEFVNDKHIDIRITQNTFKFTISVSNTYNKNIILNQGTSKKDKTKHGYGLSNIKLICEKYDGEDYIEKGDILFTHTCVFFIIKE